MALVPTPDRYLNLRTLHKVAYHESDFTFSKKGPLGGKKSIFIRKTKRSVSDIAPKTRGKFSIGWS